MGPLHETLNLQVLQAGTAAENLLGGYLCSVCVINLSVLFSKMLDIFDHAMTQ